MVFPSLHSNLNDNSQEPEGGVWGSLRVRNSKESSTVAVTILEMDESRVSSLAVPGPPIPGNMELPSDPAMQNGTSFLFSFVVFFQSRSDVLVNKQKISNLFSNWKNSCQSVLGC